MISRNARGGSGKGAGGNSGDDEKRTRWDSAGARYDILQRVGESTLFVAYRVRDKKTGRVVALKALKGSYARHPLFASTLAATMETQIGYSHPNLAQILEVGHEEGTPFLVSQWLPGQSLESRLRRAPLGRYETQLILRQLAEGLHYLHEKGLAHGDFRPNQIGADSDGTLKITDAGLHHALSAAGMSQVDIFADAVYYQSPECADNAPASFSSDLYALGVILYRMLAGRLPFDGPSPLSITLRHRRDAPMPPSQFNPECVPELETIALKLLQKTPQTRLASTREVLAALSAAEGSATRTNTATVAGATSASSAAPTAAATSAATAVSAASTSVAASTATPIAAAVAAAPIVGSTVAAPPKVAAVPSAAPDPAATQPLPVTSASATNINATSASATNATPISATTTAASTRGGQNIASAQNLAAASVSPAKVTAPAPPADDDVQLARKRQRRREAWGAGLAFFWFIIATGLLGGIFYGSYVYLQKDTPREVNVPKYIGRSEDEARRLMEAKDLILVVTSQRYDPEKPAGTVLDGQPKPGRVVRIGREVNVTVSRGEEPTTMPDFAEMSLPRAREIIARAGMKLGNIADQYHDTIPKGYISGQYPEAGQSVRRSEPVSLIVSRGSQQLEALQSGTDSQPSGPSEEDYLSDSTTAAAPSDVPLVSRVVQIRVTVPSRGGSKEVRIVVRDNNGENTVYRQTHGAGELVEEYIQVTRPQKKDRALIRVFLDNVLLQEQRI